MRDADAIYIVRFWIKPGAEEKVLGWLDNGHIGDVVALPGFLWARRCPLEESSEDGWSAHAMIYGLESMDRLRDYMASDAAKGFAKEREELGIDQLIRTDRSFGPVAHRVDA